VLISLATSEEALERGVEVLEKETHLRIFGETGKLER